MSELDVSQVTRLEVVDENGRSYTKYKISNIEFSLQDESRTLKIFLEVKKNNSVGSPIDEVYLADFRKVIEKIKREEHMTTGLIRKPEQKPVREWVGLTKEDVDSWPLLESPTVYEFAKYVEAKLKEKNNGH